eukprot:7382010-Pyramimonas_sp.AAC.1
MACTDAGPDETKGRTLFHTKLSQQPCTLVLEVNCIAHQYQLMVKNLLRFMDTFLADLGLAKVMHCWRAEAVAVFRAWSSIYDCESAMRAGVHFVPPRPITNRWGSVRGCERHILRPPMDALRVVFRVLFGGDGGPGDPAAVGVDGIS